MKKILFLVILLLPVQVSAERGIVMKEDVCGSGNVVIQLSDSMYIAAEHYSGVNLSKGDEVQGNLTVYGFGELIRADKESGEFFIQECYSDKIGDAIKALCD